MSKLFRVTKKDYIINTDHKMEDHYVDAYINFEHIEDIIVHPVSDDNKHISSYSVVIMTSGYSFLIDDNELEKLRNKVFYNF